ncbi:MAG: hypothetical protein WBE26_04910 [Phycisphaerae bacterium]
MFATTNGRGLAAFCLGIGVGLAGCNVDGRVPVFPSSRAPRVSATRPDRAGSGSNTVDILVADAHEVDLVEDVVATRAQYQQGLQQLHAYYEAHGYPTKAGWAAFELQGLRRMQQFRYLLDAEIPSDALRPVGQIEEADALYEQALELMRQGGPGAIFYRQDRMIEAAKVFRELIERYPTSDKIDDAAFFCGEIHKDYLPGQEIIAVKWYERAWTWNPETPHPARFQAAVVYDYRLHDRDRALELYQSVVKHETRFKGNARFATRRIRELTRDHR